MAQVDAHALVSLEELKEMLGYTDISPTRDNKLIQAINDASQFIERILKRAFITRTILAEPHPWDEFSQLYPVVVQPPSNFIVGAMGDRKIRLWYAPVTAVAQIVDDDGTIVDSSLYYIKGSRGEIEGLFTPPFSDGHIGSFFIDYTAGAYADRDAMSKDLGVRDIVRACKITAIDIYESPGGRDLLSKTVGPVSYSYHPQGAMQNQWQTTYGIPAKALNLLAPYMRATF